ncbi:DUF2254 domain-containing protein [Lewinella sp. W8]|uniref:DUF2254 domain-containing protein n=1 Tax=Lewinella sp. W8 TaxID=2528208 RepID=UPI001068C98D|nr:DUF2254 domain-containing protein [Lewinella sp. W8]MTB50945.1 DUF2254 domain-containing protein [Lewinella sp. W8]
MSSLLYQLRTILKHALRSLAFLPVPMIASAILLGVILFNLEVNTNWSQSLESEIPSLVVGSQTTARAVLSVLIGGLITLTVFTFTQMMSLFNQVASIYSPRLLPRFTSDRSLQLVMGTYLSVIILSVMVLLSIRSDEGTYVPNISVLACIILGIVCLVLFVYFVTNISDKIQVTNIINYLGDRCEQLLENEKNKENFSHLPPPETLAQWTPIAAPINGFVGTVNFTQLSELAKATDTRFFLCLPRGKYITRGLPIILSEKDLAAEQREAVLDAVAPVTVRFDDWYLPQIKLLTEIAVKAMSPGINDPGTALDALDRLTSCLHQVMLLPVNNHYKSPDGSDVWKATFSFGEILNACLQAIRNYAREDVLVCRKLFILLFQLKALAADSPNHLRIINREIQAVLADVNQTVSNPIDRKVLAEDLYRHRRNLTPALAKTS